MKTLRPKIKVWLGWTFFFYIILLVFLVRYQVTRNMLRPLTETPGRPADSPSDSPSPSQPDKSVQQVPAEELGRLLVGAAEQWSRESPENREAALRTRVEEFRGLNPETAEGVVNYLLKNQPVSPAEKRVVELSELDMDTIVPINMRSAPDASGTPGVWVEMQDAEGRASEYWIAEAEMSEEEKQALKAFTLMNQVPGLDKLLPLMAPLLRQASPP